MLSGMIPWKLFCARCREDKKDMFPMEEGMPPERSFSVRARYFSGKEVWRKGGIDPKRLLRERSM